MADENKNNENLESEIKKNENQTTSGEPIKNDEKPETEIVSKEEEIKQEAETTDKPEENVEEEKKEEPEVKAEDEKQDEISEVNNEGKQEEEKTDQVVENKTEPEVKAEDEKKEEPEVKSEAETIEKPEEKVEEEKKEDKKPEEKKSAAEIAAEAAVKAKSKDKKEKRSSKDKKEKKEPKKKEKTKKPKKIKKKKAPTLVEVKTDKKAEKINKIQERKNAKRLSTMRWRFAWIFILCAIVAGLTTWGFQMAGAMEVNGGIAATIGDKVVKESELTQYIKTQTYYKAYSKSSSNWSSYLSMYGMSADSFREQCIKDKYEHEELVKRACEQEEITIDDAVVQEHVDSFKNKYDSTSNYEKALDNAGYTEETYADHIRITLLEKELISKHVTVDPPSDDDVKTYLSGSSTVYADARRSSHILFDSKDTEKAKTVLEALNNNTITWDAAVSQNSIDASTKAINGDRGWDKLNSFSSAYLSAVSDLSKDQICAELITDNDGIHIIKCTDKWDTPETIESLDGVPADIIAKCREKKNESNQLEKLDEWLETFASDNGIETKIYPIPKTVPYYTETTNSSANNLVGNSDSSVPISTTTE